MNGFTANWLCKLTNTRVCLVVVSKPALYLQAKVSNLIITTILGKIMEMRLNNLYRLYIVVGGGGTYDIVYKWKKCTPIGNSFYRHEIL